ncbi:AzlD domain-containing protein [Parazoarcus communis]|mgnify:CR=1 FL=1|jgi:branched-subunit amino acid transport protein|uniref:AzlD domain-containing protein n=1 Tax=Parazoarcus communis SWub3 = DSM 12120 TaxID=1121029 RepID=A0A323V0R9_9RHOO|nr:AzlD domain-containing protein [Parazoarcus communis]NMG69128.1 AzlD domain-containing protein [Parazoarcus communis SWub3 = DSM 12120]PZA18375.1 AzlD domain-containing protein [Azoarcus communis] [Parazoarcus communis SWub3 = DSM 12120]
MSDGLTLWLTFAAIGVTTLMTRGSFIMLGEKARLPAALHRALRYAPAAALSALVVPDILLDGGQLQPLNPKLLAAVVVVVVALRWRNPWLPFILGMGVLIALRKGLGL